MGGAAGCAMKDASGDPHAWQNALVSGFCVLHRGQASAI